MRMDKVEKAKREISRSGMAIPIEVLAELIGETASEYVDIAEVAACEAIAMKLTKRYEMSPGFADEFYTASGLPFLLAEA